MSAFYAPPPIGWHTSYPKANDLIYLLQTAGMETLLTEAEMERLVGACGSYVRAAIDAFEDETDYVPYLCCQTPCGVSGATNASPIVIQSFNHGLSTGQTLWIDGVKGNTAANGAWSVVVIDANHFSLYAYTINLQVAYPVTWILTPSVGNGAYTGGGRIMPDKTRTYDAPGPEKQHRGAFCSVLRGGGKSLEIDGGLVSVTSVMTDIIYDDTGAQTNGIVRIFRRDFTLKPDNAPQRRMPYEVIEFPVALYGVAGSIQVTGRFGYCATLPEHLWRAILAGAACRLQAEANMLITQGKVVLKLDASTTLQFPPTALSAHFEPWKREWRKAVMDHTREDMGL